MDVDRCCDSKMQYPQTYMTVCILLAIYITSSEALCGEGFRRYNHPSKPLFKCCKIIECHEGYTAQECDVHNGNEKCVRDATPTFGSKTEEYPITSTTRTLEHTTTTVADLTNQVSTEQTAREITTAIINITSSQVTGGNMAFMSTQEESRKTNVTCTQKPVVSTAPQKTTGTLSILICLIYQKWMLYHWK